MWGQPSINNLKEEAIKKVKKLVLKQKTMQGFSNPHPIVNKGVFLWVTPFFYLGQRGKLAHN